MGIAGASTVGPLLCGAANPASGFAYGNAAGGSTGPYVKPVNWDGIRDNGNGTYDLLMYSTRFTSANTRNNLQERLQLTGTATVVPVPAAVWLFGSSLGLLGFARRCLILAA